MFWEMKSIPMVGRFEDKRDEYMLVAVENVVDESVDDRGFTDSLIAQEDDLVLEQGWNTTFAEIEVADICHGTI